MSYKKNKLEYEITMVHGDYARVTVENPPIEWVEKYKENSNEIYDGRFEIEVQYIKGYRPHDMRSVRSAQVVHFDNSYIKVMDLNLDDDIVKELQDYLDLYRDLLPDNENHELGDLEWYDLAYNHLLIKSNFSGYLIEIYKEPIIETEDNELQITEDRYNLKYTIYDKNLDEVDQGYSVINGELSSYDSSNPMEYIRMFCLNEKFNQYFIDWKYCKCTNLEDYKRSQEAENKRNRIAALESIKEIMDQNHLNTYEVAMYCAINSLDIDYSHDEILEIMKIMENYIDDFTDIFAFTKQLTNMIESNNFLTLETLEKIPDDEIKNAWIKSELSKIADYGIEM